MNNFVMITVFTLLIIIDVLAVWLLLADWKHLWK